MRPNPCLLFVLPLIFLAPAAADEIIVHARILHVRDDPASASDVCARVEAGQRAEVVDETEDWVRIRYADGESTILGWVASKWVTRFDPTGRSPIGRKAQITAERLNVRNGPSTSNPAIEFLVYRTEVLVVKIEDRWYKIVYGAAEGEPPTVGWIHANYVRILPREDESDPQSPERPGDPTSLGWFSIRFGALPVEADFPGRADTPVAGPGGQSLGSFPAALVDAARRAGAVRLADGRFLRPAGSAFEIAPSHRPAAGAFREVRASRSVLPPGTAIVIRQAVGLRLPDGSVHDGRFVAVADDSLGPRELVVAAGAGDDGRTLLEEVGLRAGRTVEIFGLPGGEPGGE